MCQASTVSEAEETQPAGQAVKAETVVEVADPLLTNLQHFYPSEELPPRLPCGEFTLVQKLATCIHGEVFRYQWAWKGSEHVCVKKLRRDAFAARPDLERDDRKAHLSLSCRQSPCPEDALTEIGVLQYLSKQEDLPVYLLRMLGLYQDDLHTWLITEFASGGDLFEEVARQGALGETQAKRYSSDILQAVSYLHRHDIAHRDVSLENVLLRNGAACVMDFGMAVRSQSSCGAPLRYFRAVGKDFYRAPECYVPKANLVDIVAPATATPGSIATVKFNRTYLCEVLIPEDARSNRYCRAQVYGYAAAPTDVFAAGICLFIMLTGSPPWQHARPGDSRFDWVFQNGLAELIPSWGLPAPSPEIADLLRGMTSPSSSSRLSADACLSEACFAELMDLDAPVWTSGNMHHPMMLRTLAGA